MIDSHCHIAGPEFVQDLAAVIERARHAKLTHALVILAADDAAEVAQGQRVAQAWDAVRFSIGVHPHAAGKFADNPADAANAVDAVMAEEPLAPRQCWTPAALAGTKAELKKIIGSDRNPRTEKKSP